MAEKGYPQYEWPDNLNKGLESLARIKSGEDTPELGVSVEKGRQAYKKAQELYQTAQNIVAGIEADPAKKFKDTALYHNPKRDIPLYKKILEDAAVILAEQATTALPAAQ